MKVNGKPSRHTLKQFGPIDPRLQPTLEAARREETEIGQTEQGRIRETAERGARGRAADAEAGGSGARVPDGRREGAAGVSRIAAREEVR